MMPLNHLVLQLAFGLPKDLDVGIMDPRDAILGSTNCKTSLQLVSTLTYDSDSEVATFFLTRSRAAAFIKAGYEVALVNTITWRLDSGKVKCADMTVIGDVDGEVERKILRPAAVRKLTTTELGGWTKELMGDSGVFPDAEKVPEMFSKLQEQLDQMKAAMGLDDSKWEAMRGEYNDFIDSRLPPGSPLRYK